MTINIFNAKVNIKKEHILISSAIALILALLIIYISLEGDGGVIIDTGEEQIQTRDESSYVDEENMSEKQILQNSKDIETTDDLEVSSHSEDADLIHIYIIGCVNNPGIITLKEGQLLYEAIEAAGGTTEDADLQNINMVYPLTENTMINILPKNRETTNVKDENENNNKSSVGSGVQIISDSGDAVLQFTGGNKANESRSTHSTNGKININRASIDELDTLPGIGKATARDIVKYRENNGGYKKIEDIMRVPGIKEKRFEQIKDFITVD